MKEIKLHSITTIIADGKQKTVDTIGEMFDVLNIPNEEKFREARETIVLKLLCFGEIDLSPAYPGHSVKVTLNFV